MDTVNVEVSKELVAPIIDAKIQAAIVSAMDGTGATLIDAAVARALNVNVDENGKRSDYRCAKPYITHVADKLIQEAAKDALTAWVAKNKPAITKAFEAHFNRSKSKLAKAFVDSLCETASSSWRFECKVDIEKPEREY